MPFASKNDWHARPVAIASSTRNISASISRVTSSGTTLPAGLAGRVLELAGRSFADGCLTLTFRKMEAA